MELFVKDERAVKVVADFKPEEVTAIISFAHEGAE